MDNFEKRLLDNYDSLTKSHQILAKYLFENMDKAVFFTALQIAKEADISETTVIRLAYKLSYDSFSSMHKAMQETVLLGRMKESTGEAEELNDITQKLSDKHRQCLYQILGSLGMVSIEEICDIFMNSDRILVMGYKDSYGTAVELMRCLEKIRPNVYFHSWMRDRSDILYNMAKNSLMVVVSFSPHSRFTVSEAEFMKKVGCKIIAMTDSAVNPFRHIADYNPIIEIIRDDVTGFINTAPAMSFLSHISKHICNKYKDSVNNHIKVSKKYDEEYV